jgi:mycofactocin precursor
MTDPELTTDDETETTTDLAAEALVEEVSIDGMCGVY